MTFKTIIILLCIVFVLNKFLNLFLKRSIKVREKAKKKISMPALNSLSIYTDQEFKDLINEYLIFNKYELLGEKENVIVSSKNGEEELIYFKQLKDFSDDFNKEDLYIFIVEMKLKNIKKGLILTNGKINDDIKNEIIELGEELRINYLDNSKFIKEIRELKESSIRGEV